jgi:hypothetical protein
MLDLWGIERALHAFAGGAAKASDVIDLTRRLSGIAELRTLLTRTFAANADALKANAALTALERLAYAGMSAGPLRMAMLDALEAIAMDSAMHRLAELHAWLEAERGSIDLDEEQLAELVRVTSPVSAASRLGVEPVASPEDLRAAATAGAARWKAIGNDSASSTATRAAAEVVVRSYEQLWLAAGEDAD